MSTTLTDLGIDRMSIAQRISLVQQILETVAADQQRPPISPEVRAMLLERIQDAKDNPDDCVPWEEVRDAALARFAK